MYLRSRAWTWGLLAAPLLVYTIFVVGPTLYTFYFSLTDWNVMSQDRSFIGLGNYIQLSGDNEFWQSLRITLIWTVVGVLFSVVAGFSLALGLGRTTAYQRISKSFFFLPLALSLVVVGFVWTWIYRLDDGLVNIILNAVGLESLQQAWLTNPKTALWAVIIAWTWQMVPLSMVIYLAGLTAVPTDLIEAAKIDGAGFRSRVWHVIIPSVRPATIVVVSLALINALKSFDIVYVMTKGGPYNKTETLALLSYEEAFKIYQFGYGSAIAVVLFLLTVIVIGSFTWVTARGGRDD